MTVEMLGAAENMNVRLDKNNIKVSNTIFLTSKKSVNLFNRSDLMVQFEWKRCGNEVEENHLRARRYIDLLKQEQDEIESRSTSSGSKSADISLIKRNYMVFYLSNL